jgi:hypothetical protein
VGHAQVHRADSDGGAAAEPRWRVHSAALTKGAQRLRDSRWIHVSLSFEPLWPF